MNVIIFGGSGFLGTYLTKELQEKGYSVIVCDSMKPLNISGFDFVQCDITNKTTFNAIRLSSNDIVINLAANQYHNTVPRKNRTAFFHDTNAEAVNNILEFMERKGACKFIQFSTDMVYGKPRYLPVDTGHPQNPFGPYGASKKAAEDICRAYRKRGINITIFRPRMINGPGRRGILQKMFFLVRHNLPVPAIGNGRNCYQMISVFDCVSACVAAIENGCPNKEYNLGSKDPPSVKELLTALIKNTASRSRFVKTPGKFVKAVLAVLGFFGIEPMYKEQYMIADEDYILDISETEKDLNWIPRHNDMDMIVAAYKNYIERS